MAFYFALLNVSKKDDRSSGNNNQHRKHHRRHSIASVESPLLDYRLLPRPKLLDNEDVVIPNPVALEEPEVPPTSTRRSRGSARASKWVQENHQRRANGPSSSRSQGDLHESPKISRSKRMAFPANGGTSSESPRKGKQKPSRLPVRRPMQATNIKPCRVHVERALNHHESSATDDSRRSSHDSMTPIPRREDSPASSCEGASTSMAKLSLTNNEPRMKKVTFENSPYVISNSFLGDRAVLVRRGSGTAVRLISDAATLPIQTLLCTTTKVLAPHDEVCGDDWWTPCVDVQNPNRNESPDHVVVDNRANERIEKLQVKNGRRRLLRRRSTSDKRQLLAFRNSGFLDKSQERNGKKSSSSRMTVSVDGTTTLK